jgi:hypothetical protein
MISRTILVKRAEQVGLAGRRWHFELVLDRASHDPGDILLNSQGIS